MKHLMKHNYYIILIFVLGIFYSCDTDQIEYKFAEYKDANEKSVFDTHWIPIEIVNPQIKNIYLRTNLDLNNCFFSFTTDKDHLDSIERLLNKDETTENRPQRLNVSKKLINESTHLNFFLLKDPDPDDSVYIAFDKEKLIVFGIRN